MFDVHFEQQGLYQAALKNAKTNKSYFWKCLLVTLIREIAIDNYGFVQREDELSYTNVALHVVANRKVHQDRDMMLGQVFCWTDSRQHEQLGWSNGPGTEDDLSVSPGNLLFALMPELDPVGLRQLVVAGHK